MIFFSSALHLARSLSTFKFVENSITLRIATFGNKNVCNDRYVCWIGTTFDFESNGKFICLLQTFYAKYRYTYILKDKKTAYENASFPPIWVVKRLRSTTIN